LIMANGAVLGLGDADEAVRGADRARVVLKLRVKPVMPLESPHSSAGASPFSRCLRVFTARGGQRLAAFNEVDRNRCSSIGTRGLRVLPQPARAAAATPPRSAPAPLSAAQTRCRPPQGARQRLSSRTGPQEERGVGACRAQGGPSLPPRTGRGGLFGPGIRRTRPARVPSHESRGPRGRSRCRRGNDIWSRVVGPRFEGMVDTEPFWLDLDDVLPRGRPRHGHRTLFQREMLRRAVRPQYVDGRALDTQPKNAVGPP